MTTFLRANPTADPLAQALGLINWAYEPEISAVALAPTSQTIYFESLWLPAGVPVGNLFFWIATAGAGTTPTGIYGFLDNGSTVVAQTANETANAKWTQTGWKKFALAAAYTPLASGYYRVCFLQNGAWGTTQMQLANRTTAGASSKGDLTFEPYGTGGTGQTAPPANGVALPTVAMATNAIWVGAGA